MNVTGSGYGMIASLLLETADEVCGGRIAFIMEGGYSLEGIRESGRAVMKALARGCLRRTGREPRSGGRPRPRGHFGKSHAYPAPLLESLLNTPLSPEGDTPGRAWRGPGARIWARLTGRSNAQKNFSMIPYK